MSPLPQHLSRIVAAEPTLAAWNARRHREEALTRIVQRQLPRPLAAHVRVADAEGAVLGLVVGAGAVAAIVRQRIPDLLNVLRSNGWEFTGIQVRVQVRSPPAAATKMLKTQVDRENLQPMAELARRLPAGPLKAAIERLVRKVG